MTEAIIRQEANWAELQEEPAGQHLATGRPDHHALVMILALATFVRPLTCLPRSFTAIVSFVPGRGPFLIWPE
jgi:hypothetical protein